MEGARAPSIFFRMSSRGYLWENLTEEIVAEFDVLGGDRASLIPSRETLRERRARHDVEHEASLERFTRVAREFRHRLADERRGRVKSAADCTRCSRSAVAGRKQCEYHLAIARESMRRRGMKERMPVERSGITHRFKITARCDKKKCRGSEQPNLNCTQCAGEGVYEVGGYVTVGKYEDGRIGEIFVRAGRAGSSEALLDQWAIAASYALQYGAPMVDFFKKFVGARFEPSGATINLEIPRCTSVLDYVSRWVLLRFGDEETQRWIASLSGVSSSEVRT
jgi:hypothetical protein